MNFKRQHIVFGALTIALLASVRLAMRNIYSARVVLPVAANDLASNLSRQMQHSALAVSQSDERSPFLQVAKDPFQVVNFAVPVQMPTVMPVHVPAVESKPVAPQLPYRYFGRMVDIDGKTLTFLSRDGLLVSIAVGVTLDEIYRVDAVGERQILLTYLPLNEQLSISTQSAAE